MRSVVAIAIGAAVLYAIDAYWFDGAYFDGLRRMAVEMRHHF